MLRQPSAFREPIAYLRERRFKDVTVYPVAINTWDWLHDDFPTVLRRTPMEVPNRPLVCGRGVVKILHLEKFVMPPA